MTNIHQFLHYKFNIKRIQWSLNIMHFYLFPPQNYLAEEILLGTILIHPSIFPQITPLIKEDSFFLECHQIIYKNLINIHRKNKLDIIQLLYCLSDTKALNTIGGINKIIELMKQSQVFMSSNNIIIYTKELVDIINNDYIKRLIIQYGYNVISLAYIKKFPSHQLYNQVTNQLNTTAEKIPKENMHNFKTLIGDFLLSLHKTDIDNTLIKQTNNDKYCLVSGFEQLDKLTNGLPNGDLIVIAGRPSTGKTSLAINIVYNIITEINIGVCIFSLEMSKMQILQKLISIASTIPTKQIILNKINSGEWKNIQTVCKKLLSSKVYLNDTPNMSVDYIEYTTKLLKKETKYVEIIIIDYLQLIQTEEIYCENRSQELSYITRKLKLLAQNLNVPIIILSQLNRSIETRINKQPLLSDLRESGCLNTSILMNSDSMNYLHVANIFSTNKIKQDIQIVQVNHVNNQYNILIKKQKRINYKSIHILLQYIFKIHINIYNCLEITQNHKLYTKQKWTKQNYIIEKEKILKQSTVNTNYILENSYIINLSYFKYSTVYDIKVDDYSNFIAHNIILHNSIEQDADLVMILKEQNKQENLTLKVIDIFLCKNRNGPTGSCQILFSLENTSFTNLQSKQLSSVFDEDDFM
uniref:DNA 5'-3' helicase n=1 Tax=Phyllymenia taiwanensis TaxID=1260292 RepID=R9XXR3_9FLOR|nr:putative replicative DNA helicase [Grateloupia taiwanensis]AGO19764.1 putative replicative DNA helicase [Grateloupia taiwanensis]